MVSKRRPPRAVYQGKNTPNQRRQKSLISTDKIKKLVSEIEAEIQKIDGKLETRFIGELVMEKLARIDDVAYVRFASVYRQFKDINQFMRELRDILGKRIK